ncbi:MAG: hypothetical protein LBG84_02445 [Treponema sp.]|nr:hypothetical protein [Treponema sp.]
MNKAYFSRRLHRLRRLRCLRRLRRLSFILIFALCAAGCIPYFNIPDEELRVTPFKTAYETGSVIDTAHDLEVNKQEKNGSLTRLSPGEFVLSPGILDFEGEHTITVIAEGLSGSYVVRVENLGASTPLVQAIPFKAAYQSGENVSKRDLAVYVRNLTTGEMEPAAPDRFKLIFEARLGFGEGVLGPLPSGITNPIEVTVKVPDYSSTAGARYNIWVDERPPPAARSLVVVPIRTTYAAGDVFDPQTDLLVYRNTTLGAMERISWNEITAVTMTAGGGVEEDAFGYVFTGAGNHKVKVRASGMETACSLWVYDDRLAGTGFEGALNLVYVDGSRGIMKRNAMGLWEVEVDQTARPGDPPKDGRVIYSFTPDGTNNTYLLGRRNDEEAALNITRTGELKFRQGAVWGVNRGFIPIESVEELRMIDTDLSTLAGRYELQAELDLLGGANVTVTPQTPLLEWKPIGRRPNPAGQNGAIFAFTGRFDGCNYQIRNMRITTGGGIIGLFGEGSPNSSGGSCVIRNVRIQGEIDASANPTGCNVIGGVMAQGSATIENCESRVNIIGPGGRYGGIVGWGQIIVIDCVNYGDVEAGGAAGGIAGEGYEIRGCKNQGNVTTTGDSAGGIVGSFFGTHLKSNYITILNCENTGVVTAQGDNAGGIAGFARWDSVTDVYIRIEGCKNTGAVTAVGSNAGGIGGFIGICDWDINDDWYIAACYNTGPVSAANYAGGIVGRGYYDWGTIFQSALRILACYSTGRVTSGGIFGALAGNVAVVDSDCFFDPTLSLGNSGAPVHNGGTICGSSMFGSSGSGGWKRFGVDGWPGQTGADDWWVTGTGAGNRYWKSLGNIGNGSPLTWSLPTLWWE